MNHWVVVGKFNFEAFALEKLLEVLPVVNFLVELEPIVELVHFNFLGVVPTEDLSVDPAIGEISLGILNFVGEVQTLDPHV